MRIKPGCVLATDERYWSWLFVPRLVPCVRRFLGSWWVTCFVSPDYCGVMVQVQFGRTISLPSPRFGLRRPWYDIDFLTSSHSALGLHQLVASPFVATRLVHHCKSREAQLVGYLVGSDELQDNCSQFY
jgi:hypothetical protein